MKRLLFFSLIVLFVAACEKEQTGILPQRKDITTAVYSSLRIQPKNSYTVFPTATGIMERMTMEVGDKVKKGQLLLQVEDKRTDLAVDNARLAYEEAQNDLRSATNILADIRTQIESAKIKVENDSSLYSRQLRLWQQNIGSKNQVDALELSYRLSKQNLKQLQETLRRSERQLNAKIKQAKINFQSTKTNTTDFRIFSEMEGVIYELYKEQGELVSPQTPIMRIGSGEDYVIEMVVDESDITKVYEGQKVVLTLEAYGDEVFEAKVSKVYPQMDRATQSFDVEAIFDQSPKRLYPGLNGEASLIVSKTDNALTIPLEYLIDDSEVITEEEQRIKVKIGKKSLNEVQILEGLTENTKIYLPKAE